MAYFALFRAVLSFFLMGRKDLPQEQNIVSKGSRSQDLLLRMWSHCAETGILCLAEKAAQMVLYLLGYSTATIAMS